MKKLICTVLACTMLATTAFADTLTLSLDKAIETAKENNQQLSVNDYKKAAAEISLKSAYISQKDAKNAPVMFGDTATPLAKKGYYVTAAQTNIKLLDLEREKINNNISYDVTEKYFNYILADKLVSIAESAEKLAKENLEIVNKYFELGMVAELEVKNAEAAVSKCTFTKESYIRNRSLAAENLKISLNIKGDIDFNLTDSIESEQYTGDVDAEITAAADTRYDIISLLEAYNLSKLNFEIVSIYNLSNTANYNTAYSQMLESEYNYENNKRLIELSIRNSYNNILTCSDNLASAQNDYNIKKLEYDVAKIKYDVGSITNTQLTQTMNALSASEVELENAKLASKLAVEKYKYEITAGL